MRVNLASDPAPLLAQLGWAVAPPQAEHRPPPCRVLTHCQQTECGPASAAAFHAPAPAMPPPLNTSKLRVFLLEGHTGPMNDMLHTMTTTLGVPLNQIGFMLLEVGSVRAMHAKAICVKVTASPSWPLDAVKSCDARSGPAFYPPL